MAIDPAKMAAITKATLAGEPTAAPKKSPAKLDQQQAARDNYVPQGDPSAPVYAQPAQLPPQKNEWSLQGGFDMSGPGAAEDAYARYGQQLAAPGATEQYAQDPNAYAKAKGATNSGQYTGQYNPMAGTTDLQSLAGNKGAFNDAQNATASGQYWNSLQGQSNVPKDMSAYYDRQYDKGSSRINDQMAARGMFGSSAALNQQGQFAADLGAQQAKDEAAYGLQSAGLNDQIMRGASGAADAATSNRYGQQLQTAQSVGQEGLSRYGAGLQGAGQADNAGLGLYGQGLQGAQASDAAKTSRLGVLGQGAMNADTSRQGRTNSVYDNLMGTTNDVNGLVGTSYGDMLTADQGGFDMGQQMSLGAGAANLAGVQNSSALNVAGANAAGQGATNAAQTVAGLSAYNQQQKKPSSPPAGKTG